MKNFYLLFSVILLHAFFINSVKAQSSLDIQGHRGCRGLCPENTIPGFIKAIDLGATTLEMDVVITKDNQVVLSHDPFLNHEICEGPHKEIITEKNEKEFNIYRMSYNELQKCDCGSKIHNRFLTQAKFVSYKPLLETVIDTVEKYISYKKLKPIQYNIETKCLRETDTLFHPTPDKFTELVYAIIKNKSVSSRTTLQSFDIRTLQYAHANNYTIKLALLIENQNGFEKNVSSLGFNHDVYSPNYELVSKELVKQCHDKKIKIIPWTINEIADIKKTIDLQVDGIISDYPNRVVELIQKK